MIGNIFDLPAEEEYRVYSQWHETYGAYQLDSWFGITLTARNIVPGDICSVSVLGQRVVIINSPEVAVKLLSKQVYAGRPNYIMCNDLVGWHHALVMLPYGDRFKGYRTMLKNAFGTRASVEKYKSTMESEAHHCLARLLDSQGKKHFSVPIRR